MTHRFPRGSFDFGSHVYIVDGVHRSISGNAASLLRLLVQNRDRVVSQSEIGAALAEGDSYVRTYVSTHVNRLRDGLGDGAFIRTVPRQGYQWIDDPLVSLLAATKASAQAPPKELRSEVEARSLDEAADRSDAANFASAPEHPVAPRADEAAVSVTLPILGRLLVLGAPGILMCEVVETPESVAVVAPLLVIFHALLLLRRNGGRVDRRPARSFANALTFARPAFGVAGALEIGSGSGELGLWWYFAGLATDLADGAVARLASVESAAGRDWDAMSDAFMNGAFGLGLGAVALHSPDGLRHLLLLSSLVLVFAVTRSQAHTILDKCLSGIWRVALFTMGLVTLNPSARGHLVLAGALGAVVAIAYESAVMWREWRMGRRPLLRSRAIVARETGSS